MYTLVYFVGDDTLASGFSRFREYLKMLPPKYYIRLKCLYVLHPNLILRSRFWLEGSKRGKLWQKKTQYIANLNQIFNYPSFRKRWIDLVPEHIKQANNISELIQLRNESITLNPPAQELKYENILGQELANYPLNEFGIPEILEHLLRYFVRNPNCLQEQGIFRKAGSITEETQLIELLSTGQFDSLRYVSDPNLVASLLKRFFASLKTPLFNEKLQNIVISATFIEPEREKQFIENILDQMPQLNRRILQMMLSFLLSVTSLQEMNQMTESNISVVYAPCFFKIQPQSIKDLEKIGLLVRFVLMMLKHFNSIYPQLSYKIFLGPESQSVSSTSSQGVEAQLKQFEEEKQQNKQDFLMESQLFTQQIYSQNFEVQNQQSQNFEHLRAKTDMDPVKNFQDSEEEEQNDEVSISDILSNVKENKPIEQRKSKKM